MPEHARRAAASHRQAEQGGAGAVCSPARMAKPPCEALLALQRGAGNRAVTRMLGRAVLARMQTVSDWLGKGKPLDKTAYRSYRQATKFQQAFDAAVADGTRPQKNREALKFLEGEINAALGDNDMNALRMAVDGVAHLLDNSADTMDQVKGYATEVVVERPREVEAEQGEPAVAAGDVHITPYPKTKKDFCGPRKTPRLLSTAEADMLMAEWHDQLTIVRLDPSSRGDEILKVKEGRILDDSHIRLDAEHVDRTGRYRLYRIQGIKTKAPVLAGVFVQLDTWFSSAALRDAFSTALTIAHAHQYAVLYRGEYQAPQQA